MPYPLRNRLLLSQRVLTDFTYRVSVTAGQTTTPKWTFVAGAPPAYTDWGDGTARDLVTSGVEQTHAYTNAGEYTVTLVMANQAKWLSQVDINSDKVVQVVTPVNIFKAIDYFRTYANASLNQNISNWILPTGLITINVNTCPLLTGNISGWILPSSIINLFLYSSFLTGNVSGWILPATLFDFRVYTTNISGDISGWVVPAMLGNFYIHGTGLSGCPNLSIMIAITGILVQGCALPQVTVDLYLSRCVAREAATTYPTPTLNLGGTNAAPSAAGLLNAATLTGLGWIVTVT